MYDLHVVDWNGDGVDELAVFHSTGITIYTKAGVPEVTFPWTGTQFIAAVVNIADSAKQRIAVVTDLGAATQYLGVYSQSNAFEGPVSLGTPGIVSMTAADHDGDNDSDLFFSITSDAEYWRIENKTITFSNFNPANKVAVAYGPDNRDPASNNSVLAVGDFDNDGDADVLAPVSRDNSTAPKTYGTVRLIRQGVNQQDLYAQLSMFGIPVDQTYPFDLVQPATIILTFDKPTTELTSPLGTDLRWLVMMRDTTDFGSTPLDGPPTEERLPTDYVFATMPGGNTPFEVTLDLPASFSLTGSSDILGFSTRQVILDSNEVVVASGPTMSFLYAAKDQHEAIPLIWPSSTVPGDPKLPPTNPDLGESSCDFTTPPIEDDREPDDPVMPRG